MSVLLRVAASALFAIASLSGASAQNYPTRLVHVIAPFGPGGPSDVFSRIVYGARISLPTAASLSTSSTSSDFSADRMRSSSRSCARKSR